MPSSQNPPSGTSFPPQPPPTSNNGIYVGIAVVMLLGIGAALFFKNRSEQGAETVAPLPSAVPSEPESKLDEVPLPPPVDKTAPAPTAASRGPSVAGPNPDCLPKAKCKGLPGDELETALGSRARQARRCYEAALKEDATLKGKIALTVRVAGNGSVCSTAVTQDEIPMISGCVERVFRAAGTFPKPSGGCADVAVPMSFVPNR